MSDVGALLSVVAFGATIVLPFSSFLVYRKISRTNLKPSLMTFLIGLMFISMAQMIRLLLPLFNQDAIVTLRTFHNIVHLIGDVFFIKAVFEFRDYAKVFGFKEPKKKQSKK